MAATFENRSTTVMGLAVELKESTAEVHDQAEGALFVKCFMAGSIDREDHAAHLRALLSVYAALEEGMRQHKDHPVLSNIYFPVLERSEKIKEDLAFLIGNDWESKMPETEAARSYGERLRNLAEKNPVRLAAHAYTRYLGDLSGGQILKKMAQKHLGLEEDGLAFYNFDIEKAGSFKDEYRSRLDQLPVNEEEKKEILEEAKEAFLLNGKIFAEIEGQLRSKIPEDELNKLLQAT